jgi:hypothetical protein
VYLKCLQEELKGTGLTSETERPVPVIYKGVKLDCGFRLDLIVEGKVVVEAHLPRCSPKNFAISSNASRVSGAFASRMYCAWDCPS